MSAKWKLVPTGPNYAMERAALGSRSRCDQGEHLPMFDYIDSAENHAHIVVRAALAAGIAAAPSASEDAGLHSEVCDAMRRAGDIWDRYPPKRDGYSRTGYIARAIIDFLECHK